MEKAYLLRGDLNGNGKIDNDEETRMNTIYNAKDIVALQQELKKLTRMVNVSTAINSWNRDNATFASSSKLSEELTDGKQRIYFNNIGKSVVFRYGNRGLGDCVQIVTNTGDIKNVNELSLKGCQPIKKFVQSRTGLTDEEERHAIPSMSVISDVVDNLSQLHDHDDRYALLGHGHVIGDVEGLGDELDAKADAVHTHVIGDVEGLGSALNGKSDVGHWHVMDDVYREYEEEEDFEEEEDDGNGGFVTVNKTRMVTKTKALEDVLNGKSDVCHVHAQYLTKAMIQADAELQTLMKGDDGLSAFEVWKSQQTPKEPDYTVSEYLAAIKGAKGDKGDTGDDGLSAFEVWCAENNYDPANKTYADFIADITGEPGSDGQDGQNAKKSWWEYLTTYGLTGASAAYGVAQSYATATALEALQAQIAVIQTEVTALIGEATADQFTTAIDEAKEACLSLSDYVGGDFINSITSVFRNLASKLKTAYHATNSMTQTLSVAWSGYIPLAV